MILIIAIILILILILICILVIPFDIFLYLNLDDFKIRGYFKITWIKIRLYQKKFPDKEAKKEKKEDKKQKFDISRIPQIIFLVYESSPYLIRVFNSFVKSTSFEKFYFKLTLGLGSPYYTAIFSGYLWVIISLLDMIPKAGITLEPDFLNDRIEAEVTFYIKIRLLWIVIELIRAYTKKPVRMLINEMRKMRS